ncbi:MAG: lactonase family protein [Terracidiphilus sp.]|nr:lactonase family protein [Terracidiphilus sp.]
MSCSLQASTLVEAKKQFAYAGGYTIRPDGTAHGEGIYLFEADAQTGELKNRRLAAKFVNPTWIAFHPSRKFLYASSEISEALGGNGAISAFAIDGASGALTLVNTVSSEGSGTAHISTDQSGKFLFVANYGSGTVVVLPIGEDGKLGAKTDQQRHNGQAGKQPATNAPRGSFAISGHEGSRPHMIAADANNRFVIAADLGEDRIYVYRFDAETGKLTLAENGITQIASGDGPRHFVFHPNGKWFYSIQEEASTIAFFHYDAARGGLQQQQVISTLPANFAGTSYGAEIAIAHDGRFIYCTNRLHDTVAIFSVGADGRLKALGEVPSMGDYPRHCAIDPSGRFLYVCAQRSDVITQFRIEHESGRLSFTGNYTPMSAPAVIAFL